MLIVGDWNGRDIARHLGGDRELTRPNVGVVGRLEMAGVVPVEISAWQRQQQAQQSEGDRDRMPAEPASTAFAIRIAVLPPDLHVRFEGRLPVRRGAKPVHLIRSGAIQLLRANRRAFRLRRLQERPVATFSIIAL